MRLQSTHHALVALIAFCCLTVTLSAETIFLEYNKNCTDRYEYTLTKDGLEQPFVTYHYKVRNRQVVLNVGQEATNTVPRMPAGTLTCNTSVINENMARAVNDGSTEIFLVRKVDLGYNVSKVASANVLTTEGNSVLFFNDGTDFSVARSGEVASTGSTGVVDADQSGNRHCFRTIELRTATPTPAGVTSMTMIPEIGIIEERGATDNAYLRRLVKVNGVPFGQYLKSVCKGENPNSYSQKDIRIVRGNAAPTTTTRPVPVPGEATAATPAAGTLTAKGATVNPCDVPAAVGFHKVGKGETLYGISRKYNLSVAQLREWNGMSSNTITPCDQLKISAPVSRATALADVPVRARVATDQPTAPTQMETESTVLTTRGTPAPTTTTPTPAPARPATTVPTPAATLPAWTTTADYYTATAADNVAKLAETYGYTEARFRWMNGMGATDRLKAGQLVRIRDCADDTGSRTLTPKSYEDKSGRYEDVFSNKGTSTQPRAYSSSPAPTATAPVATPGTTRRRVHVVAKGESLYGIARTYGLSTDALRELNSMDKGEVILPEQVLYIE